jgi:membrane fusion protein, multidrug efflux system
VTTVPPFVIAVACPATAVRRRRRPWRRLAGFGLGLALTGSGACDRGHSTAAAPPPTRVQVVTAAARTIPRTLETVGTLESPEPTVVAAEVPGVVTFVDIAEGRRVAAGTVLVRIDDSELRAQVAENRARFRQAQDRLQRARSLRKQGVASQEVLDDATSEYDATKAALEETQTRLDKSQIRAPFGGVLGLRQVSLGQYLEAADPVVRLSQVDPLELVFSVPQRYAGELALGLRVYGVIGRCEGRFETSVSAIDPRVDVATRMLHLKAKLPNPDGHFRPGMAVRVRLVLGEIPAAVVVPQAAIVLQGTKYLVYVLNTDNTAHQREVTLGEYFTDGVHVTSGVSDGDVVVVAGHQKLHPGAATERTPWKDTPNPVLDLGWLGPTTDCEQ